MSQMSIEEEEKVPGDVDRLPDLRGAGVADAESQAPVDDGFVRQGGVPSSLAQTAQARKFEAALYRAPEVAAQAPAVGKKGSRSKLMDGAADVMDWAGKGLGLIKEADDTAGLYGKDVPEVFEAAGERYEGLREGADAALEGYAPMQAAAQGLGKWTGAANKALNPLPKAGLGKIGETDIKLGVGTKDVLSAASGALRIAQFHKNEGADPNATALPERAAVETGQTEFRRALEARRRVGRLFEKSGGHADAGGVGMSPAHTEDGRVQQLLYDEKKRANLKAMQKGVRLALRAGELGKAQEKSGVRSLNEYSMEKTAYLNDKEFVPRKPREYKFIDEDPGAGTWSPKKGMIKDGEIAKAADYSEASSSVYDRYADQGAVRGKALPAGLMAGMQDSAALEGLPDDYRDDVEGGRSKQKQVAAARFLGGAGQLVEGTLDSKRLVRDGRYKTAYAAKAAELGVLTGAKTGAAAAQAGLIAGTGGVAAPLIAAAEAGKHLVFHAKEQLGMGMQSASEGLEGMIDPSGLAKEQDNRDLYNKHFGLQKPANAPAVDDAPAVEGAPAGQAPVQEPQVVEAPEQVQPEPAPVNSLFAEALQPQPMNEPYDEIQQIMNKKHEYYGMNRKEFQEVEAQRGAPVVPPTAQPEEQVVPEPEAPQQAPAPSYQQMTADPSARAADIRERGIVMEKQGSAAVLGRQKRTWARAGKDVLWGGTKKVVKGLGEGLAGLATLPVHAAKWGWKGLKGIGSLFSRKKPAENPARAALKQLQGHSKMGDLDRPQFDFSSISQANIGQLSKEEQNQLRLQREKYDEVFGTKAHAGAARVGGTRQAAKDALMAKPEMAAAGERAALREQLAPGPYTPRMESGEILDILRGRAKADIESEAQRPGDAGGGPGVAGPHDGGGAGGDGGPGGDLLDQIAALEGGSDGHVGRPAGSVAPVPSAPAVQADLGPGARPAAAARPHDSYEGSPEEIAQLQREVAKLDRRAARRQRKAQAMGMIQPGGGKGAQQQPPQPAPDDRRDSYRRRVDEWNVRADAAGMGLIMNPEDAWLKENPYPVARRAHADFDENANYDLAVDGAGPFAEGRSAEESASEHQKAPEGEKRVGPKPPAAQPEGPSSATRPEYLDTSAQGLRRHQRLMDPREVALLANSANPQRTQQRLPAIREAVQQAQGAETTDAATAAWRNVDRLQAGVVNRRWSGYRPSDPASMRAADARTESRRDLLGERMVDVSTSHEGLDLPSAQMPDRRLETRGDDQFRLSNFEMPGAEFDMFQNLDERAKIGMDIGRNPAGYAPKGVEGRGEDMVRDMLSKAYAKFPDRRKQLQGRFLEREREAAAGIDFGAKRVLDESGAPTADARAQMGQITVDDQPVYPQLPNLDVDANQEFGGEWRRQDTDQVVQRAGIFGAGGRRGDFGNVNESNQFGEFHYNPIPEGQVLQAPAAGWDAQPQKPGWFAGKERKAEYRQAKKARADVVAEAFGAMRNDHAPAYVKKSPFGRQEWARLEVERKARHDQLRMHMRMRNAPMGNMLFGVVQGPPQPKRDKK